MDEEYQKREYIRFDDDDSKYEDVLLDDDDEYSSISLAEIATIEYEKDDLRYKV